jgi:dihydroflavonol-4-reductase
VREATGLNSLHIPVPGWIARAAAWLASPIYRLTRIPPRLTTYALDTLATNARVSYAKAKRELGYQPRRVRQSIADTVAWFEETSRGKPDAFGVPL